MYTSDDYKQFGFMAPAPHYGTPCYGVAYNAMMNNNIQFRNVLTNEEILELMNESKSNIVNFKFSNKNGPKSICTHKDINGKSVVMPVNDGSDDVYCPICQHRWNPDMKTKEEVQELCNTIINQIENMKWAGLFPREIIEELSGFIKLLNEFPDLFQIAIDEFNKYYSAKGMYNAQDTNIYGMYNSLFGVPEPNNDNDVQPSKKPKSKMSK